MDGAPQIGQRCRPRGLEMTIGMGFPMGTGIPWDSHGNGNKRRWEWE